MLANRDHWPFCACCSHDLGAPGATKGVALLISFLINIEDIWVGLRWFKNLSHLAYTTEAAAANEFHGLVFECPEYGTKNSQPPAQNTVKG